MKRLRRVLITCIVFVLFAGSTINVAAAGIKDIFDSNFYVEKYADLDAAFGANEDALYEHYITYGVKEGRTASEVFNVEKYRSKYSDLEAAFGDDWAAYVDHYLTFGLAEGRDGGGEFDAVSYANRYPDLYEAYGYDFDALYNHYQEYGLKEGRDARSEMVEQWEREEEEDEEDEDDDEDSARDEFKGDESKEDEPQGDDSKADESEEGGSIDDGSKEEEPKGDGSIDDDSKDDESSTDAPGDDTTQAYIDRVVDLVNEEREAAGLPALKVDSRLQEAAAIRAEELKTSFSHSRPDNSLCFTVLDEFDIQQTAVGENIARYYPTPEEAMDAWMESQGHKENILSDKFTHIGVGYYVSESGMPYWVQMFIRSSDS